jgi:hypothetical protein
MPAFRASRPVAPDPCERLLTEPTAGDEPAGPAPPSTPLGIGSKAPSAAVPGLTRVCSSSLAENCSIQPGSFWARQSSDQGGVTNVQT